MEVSKAQKLPEALQNLRESNGKRKFVQTVDLVVVLRGFDPKKAENKFSKDVILPHGRGKDVSVFIIEEDGFGKADIERLASDKKALKEFSKKHEFLLCEPPLMTLVGKLLGRYLAPRGKMPKLLAPNANKTQAVNDLKKSVRVKLRDSPMIQTPIGVESMTDEQLKENIVHVMEEIRKSMPPKAQVKNAYIKLTMGRPIKVNV